jgi:glutamate synthase domain-containing protein 2
VTRGVPMQHDQRVSIAMSLMYELTNCTCHTCVTCIHNCTDWHAQALKCHTNHCPTGVTSQDPALMNGLVVSDKRVRVYNYHKKTVETALEILGAAGFTSPNDVQVSDDYFLHYSL